VKILSYNPGHDGVITLLQDARLMISIEAEKDSNYRYSPVSSAGVFEALGELDEIPDVICTGGWWPRDHYGHLHGSDVHVGYRGVMRSDVILAKRRLLGRQVDYFSSSHERSHILCAFGMSSLLKGTPCYALVWEGSIGAFYEIDHELNISRIADVMNEPGHRYALLYGLADPSFNKNGAYSLHSDAGKLMALASYAFRKTPSAEEQQVIDFLLQDCVHLEPRACNDLKHSRYYNVGLDDPEFRNLAGIFSDKIFDIFYRFAKANMQKRMPLIIAGGCGLNCDWNTKWRESGLFPEVFVPPVANDSGSAIGTAIDAQFHLTGNPKIDWNVYSGRHFVTNQFDSGPYDAYETNYELLADLLANDLILGWVSGKYEIGPRALGNRSILAAPFRDTTRVRLNEIKQREQFRPIAPVCLEEDAAQWFGCDHTSPFMLYTYGVRTNALAAVTHVNRTARIQTVSFGSNRSLYELLVAFKARTGYGVLCNTSLNFKGCGFINNIKDVSVYAIEHNLDGFVIEGRAYLLKGSDRYQTYLRDQMRARCLAGLRSPEF
jgi:predicted NodU family carbamoyl transferase